VFFIFVRADGEDISRKIFRRAQNDIMYEGGKGKTKECVKVTDNRIFKTVINRKTYIGNFFIFQVIHL